MILSQPTESLWAICQGRLRHTHTNFPPFKTHSENYQKAMLTTAIRNYPNTNAIEQVNEFLVSTGSYIMATFR